MIYFEKLFLVLRPCKSLVLMSAQCYSKTVFALSSGNGKCGISVIRVSGIASKEVIHRMTKLKVPPEPRKLVLQRLFDPQTKECIDRGLIAWFPGPDSFTGEDMCELHVHGSTAVQIALYRALGQLPHFSPAEPGEFTRRAFLNGKIGLTETEGLADLIHSETEMQRRQALRQMEGFVSKRYDQWMSNIKSILAHIEAFIDFHEEELLDSEMMNVTYQEMKKLLSELRSHTRDTKGIDRLRNGVNITIIGQTNVGKSTLFNYISQKTASIISDIPGTTRDVVRSSLDMNGYPVTFSDTAGIRNTTDFIECEGIARAKSEALKADLLLVIIDASRTNTTVSTVLEELKLLDLDIKIFQHDDGSYSVDSESVILLFNKIDLISHDEHLILATAFPKSCMISCSSETGLNNFMDILTSKVANLCDCSNDGVITRTRHITHVLQCISYLEAAEEMFTSDAAIVAENLRKACWELGKINGLVTNEDILDIIFSTFCIGK